MSDRPELFDTSGVRDEDSHWDALAARIADHAVRDTDGGMVWFARGTAGLIAASLVIAAALVAAAIPSRPAPRAGAIANLEFAIAPTDIVGRSLASPDQPPAIGTLVLGAGSREAK